MTWKMNRRQFVRQTVAAGALAAAPATYTVHARNPDKADTSKILNYSPDMEYRRCGKTELMLSAVCLGGHWKRIGNVLGMMPGPEIWKSGAFQKNRAEVVSRCIGRGINYIDACTGAEVIAYSKALLGRREKMYLGYSWCEREPYAEGWRDFAKLKQSLDSGLKEAGLEYVDLWRLFLEERSSRHSDAEIDDCMKALDWAKRTGRVRYTGISSHDREHISKLIQKYPNEIQVVVAPYTPWAAEHADMKRRVEQGVKLPPSRKPPIPPRFQVVPEPDVRSAMEKADVGWLGSKPFASNALFDGNSAPGNPDEDRDNRLARLAIRMILRDPLIAAPIPGLLTVEQVDNVALAVKERQVLDGEEKAELERALDRAWAKLPSQYAWLKAWATV